MSVTRRLSATTVRAVLVSTLGIAACDGSTDPATNHLSHASPAAVSPATAVNTAALAKDVQAMTAKYSVLSQATRAGYVEDPFCVEHPTLGGMGHHWVNGALVDPVFQPGKPEVVLYAPGQNGKMQLVAVEYIVINVGQLAPTFGGQPFDVGGTPVAVPHWSLHVWLHKTNPNGLFTPFNPDVDCP